MTLPATLAARARAFADEALSENSRRAYRADWQHYTQWCRGHDLAPLPAGPEQVASYLTSMAETHKRATIERRLVTIGQAHKLQGLPWIPAHPAVRAALRGMFRRYGRPREAGRRARRARDHSNRVSLRRHGRCSPGPRPVPDELRRRVPTLRGRADPFRRPSPSGTGPSTCSCRIRKVIRTARARS
ncbi:hypothetical protein ACU4GA_32715 [Methylobacterium oryzae CBMB20]